MKRSKTKGYVLAILAGVSASMFFIPYKEASFDVKTLHFVYLIYIFSAIFNGVPLIFRKKKILWNRFILWGGILFGLLSVFGNFSIGKSLENINPGLTVIALRSQVIIVTLLGVIFLGERLKFPFILGLFLTILGFTLLNLKEASPPHHFSSLIWALSAAFSFAFVQIMVKKMMEKIDPMGLNFVRLSMGLLFMLCLPAFWKISKFWNQNIGS